jgi:uncharacterized membrane protein YhaH (DUF805 family)
MNLIEAIKTCVIKKPLSFKGRASKSEFFGYACPWALFVIGFPCLMPWLINELKVNGDILFTIWAITFFLGMVPLISAAVRRLRDTACSGWMILIIIVPIAGPFMLLWLLNGDTIPSEEEEEEETKK